MYKIVYENRITQIKKLISHQYYLEEYIPLRIKIDEMENKKPPKSEKENLKLWEKELYVLQLEMKHKFPFQFFTDASPMYKAIETGILVLPKIQGGNHNVVITEI